MQTEVLKYGHFYHIYYRGVDSCDLFFEPDNYKHFLGLYDKHISPVADTYVWVLMPNHFHLLVRVKEEKEIGYIPIKPLSGYKTAERVDGVERIRDERGNIPSAVFHPDGGFMPKKYNPVIQFSHLLNAYAQAFNKRFERTGSLFQHPYKRKPIDNARYFKIMVLYIHNNPVHHGFCSHPVEYPWSSYLTCISVKPTKLQRDPVIGWFNNLAEFKLLHNEKMNIEKIDKWLGLGE